MHELPLRGNTAGQLSRGKDLRYGATPRGARAVALLSRAVLWPAADITDPLKALKTLQRTRRPAQQTNSIGSVCNHVSLLHDSENKSVLAIASRKTCAL